MSRTNTTWPKSYADADRMLRYRQNPDGRPVASRKIANNTWLVRDGDGIAVVLHRTAVVYWTPDGWVQLNTGGWNTPITRDRIYGCTPAGTHIYRDKRHGTAFTVHTGYRWDADLPCPGGKRVGSRLPNGRYARCEAGSCSDRWHRGGFRTTASYTGEFRDGVTFHIDDPGNTVRFDAPRHVAPPTSPRSRYPQDYYGPDAALTTAERVARLRREVAELTRQADYARDPEFPYSPADAQYGETYHTVETVRAGGAMPPAAEPWTTTNRRAVRA